MHFGLRGGVCGADTWGMRAGEEPEVRDLREFGKRDEKAGEGLGEDGEDWYAGLRDVQGAWGIGLKHRVRWREEGDGVMWLLKQSNGSQRDIDKILEEILMTV